jgi:lysophospholipase L1-like esterase
MSPVEFLNLFVYSDSLAFRRPGQPHDLSFVYPVVLKHLIESRLGVRVNLVMRGSAGAALPQVRAVVVQDTGYYGGTNEALNIAIIQAGVVDAARHPFTYRVAPLLRKIPVLGERALAALVPRRRQLQLIWSYCQTPKPTFVKEYKRIVDTCRRSLMRPIAVGMPLPTDAIETRSPGFRNSVAEYNELIRQTLPEAFCDVEAQFAHAVREQLLLEDGHHLTEAGHRLYAEALLPHVESYLSKFVRGA